MDWGRGGDEGFRALSDYTWPTIIQKFIRVLAVLVPSGPQGGQGYHELGGEARTLHGRVGS